MKKMMVSALLFMVSLCGFAQSEVQFSLIEASEDNLPKDVADALNLRLREMLTRNNAAAADPYNVFVLEPALEVTELMEAEGMMRNAAVALGTLTLIAKNKVDGTEYYSMRLALEGSALGGEEAAMKSMITRMKVTNTAFTRFIRTTRQKITAYYEDHCDAILLKAKNLCLVGKYREAYIYLSAVPVTAPCYDRVSDQLAEIAPNLPDNEVTPDTVVIREVVETPAPTDVPEEEIEEEEEEEEDDQPAYKLTIDGNDLDFRLLECYGDITRQRISLLAECVNRNEAVERAHVNFVQAITDEGESLRYLEVPNGYGNWAARNMPVDVKLKLEFYITRVKKFNTLSYVELSVRNVKIVIRDLPIRWE